MAVYIHEGLLNRLPYNRKAKSGKPRKNAVEEAKLRIRFLNNFLGIDKTYKQTGLGYGDTDTIATLLAAYFMGISSNEIKNVFSSNKNEGIKKYKIKQFEDDKLTEACKNSNIDLNETISVIFRDDTYTFLIFRYKDNKFYVRYPLKEFNTNATMIMKPCDIYIHINQGDMKWFENFYFSKEEFDIAKSQLEKDGK